MPADKKGKKLPGWFVWIILLFAAILGPFLIDIAYDYGNAGGCAWKTWWQPEDVLNYYGTLLSAFISVVILRITILHEREQQKKELLLTKQNDVIVKGRESFSTLVQAVENELRDQIYDFSEDRLVADYLLGFDANEVDFECKSILCLIKDCEKILLDMKAVSLDIKELQDIIANMREVFVGLCYIKKMSAQLRDPILDTKNGSTVVTRAFNIEHCRDCVAKYKTMLEDNRQSIEDVFRRMSVICLKN